MACVEKEKSWAILNAIKTFESICAYVKDKYPFEHAIGNFHDGVHGDIEWLYVTRDYGRLAKYQFSLRLNIVDEVFLELCL